MAELRYEGDKPGNYVPRPTRGFYVFTHIARFLRTNHKIMHAHVKALGIELNPFKRDDLYVKKVYSNKYDWISERDAERIIERHRALMGRKLDD